MTPRPIRKRPGTMSKREFASKLEAAMEGCDFTPRREGELADSQDPEQAGIFLAACRIVIGGYRAEISRDDASSLYVRAAYELLRHFLEEQFAPHSRVA